MKPIKLFWCWYASCRHMPAWLTRDQRNAHLREIHPDPWIKWLNREASHSGGYGQKANLVE